MKSLGTCARLTGAQAMAVAGIEFWFIQAFCRVLEHVRDCQDRHDSAGCLGRSIHGGARQCPQAVGFRVGGGNGACLRRSVGGKFSEKTASRCLMADKVREQIQGHVLQVAGVGPVRFVSCAEVSSRCTLGRRTQSRGVGDDACIE